MNFSLDVTCKSWSNLRNLIPIGVALITIVFFGKTFLKSFQFDTLLNKHIYIYILPISATCNMQRQFLLTIHAWTLDTPTTRWPCMLCHDSWPKLDCLSFQSVKRKPSEGEKKKCIVFRHTQGFIVIAKTLFCNFQTWSMMLWTPARSFMNSSIIIGKII